MTMVREADIDGRRITIKDVWGKTPSHLMVPIREITDGEGITLGFRQNMIDLKDRKGNGGEVATAAGLGGEAITLDFKDGDTSRSAVIRGSDLLIAWVATFAPEVAKAMQGAQ